MALLELNKIHASYGLSRVLHGISLGADTGEIVGLLGRNGVGKTTTLRTIIGLTRPTEGSVKWNGQDITHLSTHEINRLGIGFVPEDRRIFSELTVWENLDVAYRSHRKANEWNEERVYKAFPDLKALRNRKGGNLSGGEQQMLTIGRSLMGNPRLLLLDEPSEGLAPLVVRTLRDNIRQLRDSGLSIMLAEQNLGFVLELSDRIHILEKGEVKFSGKPDDVEDDEALIKRYLTV